MRRPIVLMMALAMVIASGAVAPAIADGDNGKAFAEGSLESLGIGSDEVCCGFANELEGS